MNGSVIRRDVIQIVNVTLFSGVKNSVTLHDASVAVPLPTPKRCNEKCEKKSGNGRAVANIVKDIPLTSILQKSVGTTGSSRLLVIILKENLFCPTPEGT